MRPPTDSTTSERRQVGKLNAQHRPQPGPGDISPCSKAAAHIQIACPKCESPLTYIPAIAGELVLGGQR